MDGRRKRNTVELRAPQRRAEEVATTYPSGHLDATAEIDVAPVVLVVDGPLPLLDVDRPGGGSEDDAAHGAGLPAGSHDAHHSFHRRLDHLVLQRQPKVVCANAAMTLTRAEIDRPRMHTLIYLRVFGLEVHGRGDVEDAGAAPDGVVEAAFHRQVGFP